MPSKRQGNDATDIGRKFRPCGNFIELNKRTIDIGYPLPIKKEMAYRVSGRIVSKINLHTAYIELLCSFVKSVLIN